MGAVQPAVGAVDSRRKKEQGGSRGERESVGEKQRAGEGGAKLPASGARERERDRPGGAEEEEGTAQRV